MITAAKPRYLTVSETAKLIRIQLKKQFPNTKFSVRSSSYSGGASIRISWIDGQTQKTVERYVRGFEGSSFDGMNDLKSYQDCWLLPDGSAVLAERPESYGGSIPGYVSDAPHPNAELVSFGADFVFCNREISDYDTRHQAALDYIRTHCHCEGNPPSDRFGNEWVDSLASRMARLFEVGESIDDTFKRVVLNHGF